MGKYVFAHGQAPGVWMVKVKDEFADEVPSSWDGGWLFTFDKKKIFNFWPDYPEKLTAEQKALFKKAFPGMARLRD